MLEVVGGQTPDIEAPGARAMPVFVYVVACALFVAVAGHYLGASILAPLRFMVQWATKAAGMLGLSVALLAIVSLRSKSPISFIRARLRMEAVREGLATYVSLVLFMAVFFCAKNLLVRVNGFHAEAAIAHFDAMLHGGDAWRLLKPIMVPWMLKPVEFAYHTFWAFMVMSVTLWACLRPDRAQYVWSFLLCWTLMGCVCALLGMSAGPAFYQDVTGDPRFNELTDFLSQSAGVSAYATQRWLWDLYANEGLSSISAFPSMHVASTTLFALWAFTVNRWLGWIFTAYKVLIMVGSVYLGWHYAVDGYVSTIGTTLIWWGVGAVLAAPARQRPLSLTYLRR
jgi:hypothetical protein